MEVRLGRDPALAVAPDEAELLEPAQAPRDVGAREAGARRERRRRLARVEAREHVQDLPRPAEIVFGLELAATLLLERGGAKPILQIGRLRAQLLKLLAELAP